MVVAQRDFDAAGWTGAGNLFDDVIDLTLLAMVGIVTRHVPRRGRPSRSVAALESGSG